jgi:hypothetical protein
MACARLGQPCDTATGTPGDHICCPDLICGDDLLCCKGTNDTCVADSDCCADNSCRPNPTGLGNRCLPPGEVGAECLEDADCAGTLICDTYVGQCLVVTGEPCVADNDCVSGRCDVYTSVCVECQPVGGFCASGADCCSGQCDPYTGLCFTCDIICSATDDFCAVGGAQVCCNGAPGCFCATTLAGDPVCISDGQCGDCTQDTDCGPGQICIAVAAGSPCCAPSFTTACASPCGTVLE